MEVGVLKDAEDSVLARVSAAAQGLRRSHHRKVMPNCQLREVTAALLPGHLEQLNRTYGDWLHRNRGLGPVTNKECQRTPTFPFGAEQVDPSGEEDYTGFRTAELGDPGAQQ